MPVVIPLVALDVLVTALFAIACALLITFILREVAKLVADIPIVGGALARAINAMTQPITYVLGKAEHGVDAAIGASWHALSRLTDMLWHQIEAYALGYLHLAQLVGEIVYAHSGLRSLVHRIEHRLHGIEHGVKTFEREWRGIEAKVKRIEHDLTRGIGHDLRIGLRDVRKEVKGIEHTVSDTLPQAIDYAEAKTSALGRFIGAIPGISYAEWVAGIAVAGIAKLGLDWIKCDEGKNVYRRRGCGMWDDFDGLLGLFVDLFIIAEVCDVLPVLDAAVSEVATPLVAAMTDVGAGLCGPGSSPPAQLDGPTTVFPPVYFTGKLVLG